MQQYTTRISCEVAGQWRVAGSPFAMTDEQAAELIAPRGNVVALWTPTEAEKEPTGARIGRSKRRNRSYGA